MKKLNGFGKVMLTAIVGWSTVLGIILFQQLLVIVNTEYARPSLQEAAWLGVVTGALLLWVVPVSVWVGLLMWFGRKPSLLEVTVQDAVPGEQAKV